MSLALSRSKGQAFHEPLPIIGPIPEETKEELEPITLPQRPTPIVHTVSNAQKFLERLGNKSHLKIEQVSGLYSKLHRSTNCFATHQQHKKQSSQNPLCKRLHCTVLYKDKSGKQRYNICELAIAYLAVLKEFDILKKEQSDFEKNCKNCTGTFGRKDLHPKTAEELLILAVKCVKKSYNSTPAPNDIRDIVAKFGQGAFRPEIIPGQEQQLTPEQAAKPAHPQDQRRFIFPEDPIPVIDKIAAKEEAADFGQKKAVMKEIPHIVGQIADRIFADLLRGLVKELNDRESSNFIPQE